MGKAIDAVRKAPYVVALGAGIALVGSLGVASAATGGNFVLGHTNSANAISVLKGTAGTPLSLVAPSGKAPLKVSNSVRIPHLNADLLDGLHANSLTRESHKVTQNTGWSEDGRTNIQTVTIVAPRAGWIFLSGSTTASTGTCSSVCDAVLRFHEDVTNTDTVSNGGEFNGADYVPLATSTVIKVAKGSHTIHMVGSWFGTTGEPTWYDPSFTAVFLPINGSGGLG